VTRARPALARRYALRVIEAEAHADFTAARAWLSRLGFTCLGTVPDRAGTSETYARYRLWVQSH
jgi:RimJ/RimL family protein N-acetyltransferase